MKSEQALPLPPALPFGKASIPFPLLPHRKKVSINSSLREAVEAKETRQIKLVEWSAPRLAARAARLQGICSLKGIRRFTLALEAHVAPRLFQVLREMLFLLSRKTLCISWLEAEAEAVHTPIICKEVGKTVQTIKVVSAVVPRAETQKTEAPVEPQVQAEKPVDLRGIQKEKLEPTGKAEIP